MSRPTTFCTCGEYAAMRYVTIYKPGYGYVTEKRLVHIDADGNVIHRAHRAKLA